MEQQKPKAKLLSKERNTIRFCVSDINTATANTLRRIIISDIPTFAIDTCHIYTNSSIVPDETLAHRLGLIPIRALGSCKDIRLNLHVRCEQNQPLRIVYSSDIVSQHARPVEDDILIAKLSPGQEINITMFCVQGTGKQHAKWSPVTTAFFTSEDEHLFIFTIEGTGVLDTFEVVSEALKIMLDDCNSLLKKISPLSLC